MPKVGSYVQKENEVRAWIAYGMAMAGIRTQKDLAKRMGMPASSFQYRVSHPETLRLGEIWQLEKIIGSRKGFEQI